MPVCDAVSRWWQPQQQTLTMQDHKYKVLDLKVVTIIVCTHYVYSTPLRIRCSLSFIHFLRYWCAVYRASMSILTYKRCSRRAHDLQTTELGSRWCTFVQVTIYTINCLPYHFHYNSYRNSRRLREQLFILNCRHAHFRAYTFQTMNALPNADSTIS